MTPPDGARQWRMKPAPDAAATRGQWLAYEVVYREGRWWMDCSTQELHRTYRDARARVIERQREVAA